MRVVRILARLPADRREVQHALHRVHVHDPLGAPRAGTECALQMPSVVVQVVVSPAVALDQSTTGASPRSTVGTLTELYDLLRLLWARAGTVSDASPATTRSHSISTRRSVRCSQRFRNAEIDCMSL